MATPIASTPMAMSRPNAMSVNRRNTDDRVMKQA
jgi:hypothetical protein